MILKDIAVSFTASEDFQQIPENPGSSFAVEGITKASYPLIIAALFIKRPRQYLIITDTSQKMQELYLDLSCFVDEKDLLLLPPWETLPYEFVSPPESVERNRVTSLYRLMTGTPCVCITTVEALMRKLPSRNFFQTRGLDLEINEDYPFDDIIETLASYGYSREQRVESYGHFSVKGGIIDVFLPNMESPVRLDFFDDTLESIREFDLNSQISTGQLEKVILYPRRELILFDKEQERLYDILEKARRENKDLSEEIILGLDDGFLENIRGIEDLFPAVMDATTLNSYLTDTSSVLFLEENELAAKRNLLMKTFSELYERRHRDTICLEPEQLIDHEIFDRVRKKASRLQAFTSTPGALNWKLKGIQNFHGRIKSVREEIERRLEEGWKIIITTGFEGQARRLYDLLASFNPGSDFNHYDPNDKISIIISPYREGVEISSLKLLILSDQEIFGKSYRKKKQFKKKSSRPIESFLDLKEGDYVVHINHGIGTFRGIERMAAGGVERDFLLIEYADGDKLYVSLDQITLVQKYIGFDGRTPRIDSLGKKSAWNRIKQKVQESVEEIARELITIYSQRSSLKGYQYPPDTNWQEEFESLFEYEETPDQITAIEDVKDDMESDKPMDRLVCGDVGFGKTEVAIRAAFKGVMAGRQVAILVPTTILAMQHFNTFKKRFAEYPITIDMISRFRTRGQVREIKDKLSKGELDIVIGTHALLAKDMQINHLGLLIIDEEQKFGVQHTEQLKMIRTLVDVLTLSATPIPRTLHMSMAGIRDLSTITTPPENRQAIETYVLEDNPDILKMAIMNEIDREGQIFYVHNRVQTIDAQAEILQRLVPEAAICVAHGQMNEHELEEIMIDFLNRKYDILVSTTIIESGLDMPNVNTIIINRADTFGLSQLYQLKGRVGRSIRKSFAYLFYPKHVPLSEEAQKRLQVISEYSELGSGLKVAMKDLEIRGAGNILGKEQSGSIMEVGFDLYCQMLDKAVKRLQGEEAGSSFRTPVFVKTDFFIPGSYIGDERQKIEFYKRFESCDTPEEVESLEGEMIDRFGPPPGEVKVLVELEKIRAIASTLQIAEILEDSRAIKVKIGSVARIDRAALITHIAEDERLSIDPRDQEILIFKPPSISSEKKLLELKKWLQQLS